MEELPLAVLIDGVPAPPATAKELVDIELTIPPNPAPAPGGKYPCVPPCGVKLVELGYSPAGDFDSGSNGRSSPELRFVSAVWYV